MSATTATPTAAPTATPASTPAGTPHRPGTAEHSRSEGGRGGASRLRRAGDVVVHGREGDPRWARPALGALLVATAVLYLVGLSANGYANAFYSAAAQAGSVNWEAFLFGSSDAANSISVDKPPASLWVMALSVRVFGLSSWSLLVPQALMGVATVGIVWGTVRRSFGHTAGLLAGAVLALTPVAALMFRFDNPDALLVLLMVGATAAVLRGVADGRTRWLVLAGALLGLGFLTKQLQVFLVLPGLALAYLLAGPVRLGRRVVQLLAGGAALVVAAGWWVALVELLPASARPWVGGSQTNSFLELTFGYNGFGRLTGDETGSVGGGGGGAAGGGMWGATGIGRLFSSDFGGQIAWLLPASLVLTAAGLVVLRRVPRTDGRRAAFVAWGGWLLVTAVTFSFASGIIHPYYSVALAPAIAALVGAGAVTLWRARGSLVASITLGATVALTAVTSWFLLSRSPDFLPWLRYAVLVVGLAAAVVIAVGRHVRARAVLAAALGAAVLAGLAGPAAYAVETTTSARSGSIVSGGPAVAGGGAGFGGGFARRGGTAGQGFPGGTTGRGFPGGIPGQAPGGTTGQAPTGQAPTGQAPTGQAPTGQGRAGGGGGLLDATTPGAALTALLSQDASSYTWVAAAVGSQTASGYQLATQDPVMPIGGFNGSDPSPTLAQFQQDVAQGRIHYFIGGNSGRGGGFGQQSGGSSAASEITAWVTATFTAQTVDGVTVYDLTASGASAGTASTDSGTTT